MSLRKDIDDFDKAISRLSRTINEALILVFLLGLFLGFVLCWYLIK